MLCGSGVYFPDGSEGLYGLSAHATAVGGILLGYDPVAGNPQNGGFFYKGVCPEASVQVYEFWRFVSLTVFGGKEFPADILTFSLGDPAPAWWTRGIERLSDETGVLVVASAGNGSKKTNEAILYPAAGANVLAVGVLDAQYDADGRASLKHFTLPRKQNSGCGPTADLRCKPDMVSPGRAACALDQ